jgi:hypothetical protein
LKNLIKAIDFFDGQLLAAVSQHALFDQVAHLDIWFKIIKNWDLDEEVCQNAISRYLTYNDGQNNRSVAKSYYLHYPRLMPLPDKSGPKFPLQTH